MQAKRNMRRATCNGFTVVMISFTYTIHNTRSFTAGGELCSDLIRCAHVEGARVERTTSREVPAHACLLAEKLFRVMVGWRSAHCVYWLAARRVPPKVMFPGSTVRAECFISMEISCSQHSHRIPYFQKKFRKDVLRASDR